MPSGARRRARRKAARRNVTMAAWEPIAAIVLGVVATLVLAQAAAAIRNWGALDASPDAACPQTAVVAATRTEG